MERDPNNKIAGEPGAKLDAGKPPVYRGLLDYFPLALISIAEVSEVGSKKYCWGGWKTVDDGINRYSDAILRHMCKDSSGELKDVDTGLLHKAHAAWGALAVLQLYLEKQMIKTVELKIMQDEEEQREARLGNQGSIAAQQIKESFVRDPNLSPGL